MVISTREGAYKTRNLRRDPTAVLCVVSDDFFGRWLDRGDGAGRVAAGGDGGAGRLLPAHQREHPDWDDYRHAMEQQQRVLVRVSIDAVGPPTLASLSRGPGTTDRSHSTSAFLNLRVHGDAQGVEESRPVDWRATMNWQAQLQEGGEVVGAIRNPR